VLVIGAGGAGLRAAIEAAAVGTKVGVVCKSLLGKAHTVMAEGGIAAALANVDDRDNWRVHFRTPCAVDNTSTTAHGELHAKESPDRVKELEAWGALFDRTKDGRILQRNFGGHRIRAWPCGRPHRPGMIRTLQDHGIHSGMRSTWSAPCSAFWWTRAVSPAACATIVRKGIYGVAGKGRRAGHRRHRRAFKITSNSWNTRGTAMRWRNPRRAELLDMSSSVSSHRMVLADQRSRHPGDRSRTRRCGVLRNSEAAVHVRRYTRSL